VFSAQSTSAFTSGRGAITKAHTETKVQQGLENEAGAKTNKKRRRKENKTVETTLLLLLLTDDGHDEERDNSLPNIRDGNQIFLSSFHDEALGCALFIYRFPLR